MRTRSREDGAPSRFTGRGLTMSAIDFRNAGSANFRYGSLIRAGVKFKAHGKWDAMLDDSVRTAKKNAELTLHISLFFKAINPASGRTGLHPDSDTGKIDPETNRPLPPKKIQQWAPGEFELFKQNL